MYLLLFYLFIALFISSLCSVMEAVLLSTPTAYLKAREDEGSKTAKLFSKLKKNIERPLSAILTLNTIAHTIGAAGVGLEASKYFGEAHFGIISTVLTLLILIFSEIIPKTIGARYWKALSGISGIIINGMVIITYPLVIFSGIIASMFGEKDSAASVSREEISAMAKLGAAEGSVEEHESSIIQNIMELNNVRVADIITPRVVVTSANEEMTLKEFLQNKEYLYFSRIPVYSEKSENITGYVFRQHVFEYLAEQKELITLKMLKREMIVIPEILPVLKLWELLLEKKEYMSLVVDEFGGMSGIATMEDIIESILGLQIIDERDKITNMQQYAKERWNARKAKYNFLDNTNTQE